MPRGLPATVSIGDKFVTDYGACRVIAYGGAQAVTVRFEATGYEGTFPASRLRKGKTRDPFHPSAYGFGYLGVGPHLAKYQGEDGMSKVYTTWRGMMGRVYGNRGGRCYDGVTVCEAWANFQNFAPWLIEQPAWGREGFELDKDFRVWGSKVYSPETCSLVPFSINLLFAGPSMDRVGAGCSFDRSRGRFFAQIKDGNRNKNLGFFPSRATAIAAYYAAKIERVTALATQHREEIHAEVYDLLTSLIWAPQEHRKGAFS